MPTSRFTSAPVIVACVALLVMSAQKPVTGGDVRVDAAEYLREVQRLRNGCDEQLQLTFATFEGENERALTAVEREELSKSLRHEKAMIVAAAVQKSFLLVQSHAAESDAIEPLIWIASQFSTVESPLAAALLMEHHLTHAMTIELAFGMRRSGKEWVERMLRAQVADRSLPEKDRPRLMLALAQNLNGAVERGEGDVKRVENEAIELFTDLARKHGDKEYRAGVTYGELSTSSLFEITNLRIGKIAPEIEGKDLDGKAFKLSDYRGMVVLVSFWASWCGPCMAHVPHESELVKKYDGRPFVIIGVNADPEKQSLSRLQEMKQVSWRSFWCGEKGALGPIPRKWNVNTWPTFYLIDHAGVIRAKWIKDAEIEKLVVEAEQASR